MGSVVNSVDDGLEGVAPYIRDFWDISVSRLKESTAADKVKTHLQKYGIEVREVFILASKIKGTKAAKVRVALEQKDRVKLPEIWPQHCKVADWINFNRKATDNNGL